MIKDEFIKGFADYYTGKKEGKLNRNEKLHGNKKPMSFSEAKDIIDSFCDFSAYIISIGEEINLPGYFVFGTKIRKGRMYRDPRNNNPVKKNDWVAPYCKFGTKIITPIREMLTVECDEPENI